MRQVACMFIHSVVSDSLQPRGLQPTRLLYPQDCPGQNTGVACHFLLQGIFLTQGLSLRFLSLLHLQVHSSPLSHLEAKWLGFHSVESIENYEQNTLYLLRKLLQIDKTFVSQKPCKISVLSYIQYVLSHSVRSDSLRPHGLQHARLPCPSPSPGACSNSCPLSR